MEYKLTSKMFYEALKEDRLLGLKCHQCGAYTCPPKIVCSACTSHDLEIVTLNGKGTVRTFTVIYIAPQGYQSPYIVGMIELDEGPWVMGNIMGIDPEKATMDLIGKRVKIGHKVFPGDIFSAGEQVAMAFSLED